MTLRGESIVLWKGISGKKGSSAVSFQALRCCNKEVKNGEIWILQDYNGFSQRKIYTGKCLNCTDDVVFLYQKRINDKKEFGTTLTGIEAVKCLYREKKRIVAKIQHIKSAQVHQWIYGTNVEIRDKSGKVIKTRQYSTDFKTGAKVLIKEIKMI